MTQLCLPRPKALADALLVPARGLGAGEGPGSAVRAHMSCWEPSWPRLLDSALGLGALGLTVCVIFAMVGPALLLLLLLGSFLAFDLLHRPAGPTLPQQRLLFRDQSQGAGEGLGWQETHLHLSGPVPTQLKTQDALLVLLMGLGLLLVAHGMPLTLLGLAFCLHPWA
ncbi:uncharacterized protein C20orf141 homolog [Ochotona princeps]|uniref:uncharacterized protein C20orf141 homolog n=1 Tax=Ochotona princeps TaxID=9978 RepID=UPI0027153835|nr:uncharacterized protein C20orf141 homolog [Ochotona princeps]